MEELRKLEEAQRMLTFMEERGFSSSPANDPTSRRFLSNLFLFLMQPCGDLDMEKKCSLLRDTLPKISGSFLEEASLVFNHQRRQDFVESNPAAEWSCDKHVPLNVIDGKDYGFPEMMFGDIAVVGLDAMERANSTLEDFCRSYLMFHEMDVNKPQLVFKFLPVLAFTESYIYQIDSLNEKMVDISTSRAGVMKRGCEMQEVNGSWFAKCMDMLRTDPFSLLVHQLESCGLMTGRIREELKYGEEYWTLERKLCLAIVNQKQISKEDVMRAIHLKSFDYRVLNLLLYELRGAKVDDLHMEFLSFSELLVEISDDLFDYEDDVLENNFNTLRMFVHMYGPSTAPGMLAKCIAEAEEKYAKLLKHLDPQLSFNYQKRCKEATKEGGKEVGHPLGTWNIPPVIVDEELYRLNFTSSRGKCLLLSSNAQQVISNSEKVAIRSRVPRGKENAGISSV